MHKITLPSQNIYLWLIDKRWTKSQEIRKVVSFRKASLYHTTHITPNSNEAAEHIVLSDDSTWLEPVLPPPLVFQI